MFNFRKKPQENKGLVNLKLVPHVNFYNIEEGFKLLRLNLNLHNQGKKVFIPEDFIVRVQQIRPWPKGFKSIIEKYKSDTNSEIDLRKKINHELISENRTDVPWPLLAGKDWKSKDFSILANETKEILFDFVLAVEKIELVQIFILVKDKKYEQKIVRTFNVGDKKVGFK